MATVKKKIVKACKGVSFPRPSNVSANLKRGGKVKKAQFGNTTPKGSCAIGKACAESDASATRKANRLASMSDAKRERVEARMDRREERKANREERRNTPRSERSSRGPRFGGFKTGGTIKKSVVKKAQKGANVISSKSNCKGGDCRKTAEEFGNRARGYNIFQKIADRAQDRRIAREELKQSKILDAEREARRDTAAERRAHEAYLKREKEQGEDVSTAQRMSEARNKGKQFPYKDVNKIYDSLQNVRKYRSSVGPSPSTSAGGEEGKSTGEYIMGKYKMGGKIKKTGSKLVKKASLKSMKSGGMIKKSAVKKSAVKKAVIKKSSIKVKSKKK